MKGWNKIAICFVAALAAVSAFWSVKEICSASDSDDKAKVQSHDVESAPSVTKPMIIWFHSGASNSPESLKLALSSGLITHVILLYMHRADADWKANTAVQKAIEIVKKSDAKLIWSRDLWPYYANAGIKLSDLFDPNYYIKEIRALRAEAKEIGAGFVSLDNEAYANSRMKHYLKGRRKLSHEDLDKLRAAIDKTVATVGKVDFTMHAGWSSRPCVAILAQLGRNRICEETYWLDEERYKAIKYPYEIFGVYVNTVRKRPGKPNAPYFLVSDIFERAWLWSDTKGLFLFTDSKNAMAVAKELLAYANNLPRKGSFESKGPNSP